MDTVALREMQRRCGPQDAPTGYHEYYRDTPECFATTSCPLSSTETAIQAFDLDAANHSNAWCFIKEVLMQLIGGCRIHKGKIVGWGKSRDRTNQLTIEVVTGDNELIWQGRANLHRADLKEKGIGNGSYGFSCQIPAHLLKQRFFVHVREATSGKDIPNSPVEVAEAFQNYRNRLLRMLAPPIWGIYSHILEGQEMTVKGYLVAPEGEFDRYGIYVDGTRIAEMSDQERNIDGLDHYKAIFWFSSNNDRLGFQVAIDVGKYTKPNELDQTPSIRIGIGKDEKEAATPLRQIYIPVLQAELLVLPNDDRRKRVQRNTSDVQFVTLGYSHYHYYRHLFERYSDRAWGDIEKMLDWGCGCGRVSQFFIRSHRKGTVVGVDIDKDNIAWCQGNLTGGNFESSELYPPLPFDDKSFDYIVATSVFTHLERDTMSQWLAELGRVLKPKGIAALTVNTDCTPALRSFDENALDLIQRDGIYDAIVSPDLGNHLTEKDYYRNVFMSKEYVRKNWGEHLNILDIENHVFGHQDVVICQRR